MTDVELLEQHRRGSEHAFADIVRRHLGWVYGVARRRLHDSHLADDVAQAVFVLLHRKAPRFTADAAMISWLHKTAWYATEVAARTERRRRHHETEAAMRDDADTEVHDDWHDLAPMLDEWVGKLGASDRDAILLRYYRDLSYAEVGGELGITEDAARKRVTRAVEKLRDLAGARSGMAVISAASLSTLLAEHVRIPPPPGLLAATSAAGTASAGLVFGSSVATIVKGATSMMTLAKAMIIGGAVAAMATVGGILVVAEMSPPAPPATAAAPATQPAPDTLQIGQSYPRVSPFQAIRWINASPQVQVSGVWYEPVALNDCPIGDILNFAARKWGQREVEKRFSEDLFELLAGMRRTPGKTVKLDLRTLDTGDVVTLKAVPMTEANRQAIFAQAAPLVPRTVPDPSIPKVAAFSAVRWDGDIAQVQVNNKWYELLALDDLPAKQILDFTHETYGDALWHKRFEEDLVAVLMQMKHTPESTVKLQLRDLDSKEEVTLPKVEMTEANRRLIKSSAGNK